MTIRPETISVGHRAIRSATLFFCVYLLMTLVPMSRAEDGADRADNMLENLKRRSAEERWQRVKKLYPVDSPASNRRMPSTLPDGHQKAMTDDGVPPSPGETSLIPRLTAAPANNSDDWILPKRQPAADGESALTTSAPNDTSLIATDVEKKRPARATINVAVQDSDPKPAAEVKDSSIPMRALHERTISEIKPYYDRDRDTDIRDFAIVKGREMDIMFKPKAYTERSFPEITLAWEASNLTYYPLYFSDPALERYGHSYHPLIQPVASIARVGAQFILLPYQMTILPPCKEESPLGWYRPGDCAPKLHYQVPLNAEAAVVEAAAVTGLYFIIP